jgi:DNA-binding XRE family transcriptional regulator
LKTNELKAEIVKNGYTQREVAKLIGLSPKTFYSKMKKGTFGLDEAKALIKILKIDDPITIFLSEK